MSLAELDVNVLPYAVVSFAEASLFSSSAAPVVLTPKSLKTLNIYNIRMYNFRHAYESVCLSVCLVDDNFWKSLPVTYLVYIQGIRVKLICERHRVTVKVTGSKTIGSPYSCNVELRLPITPVLENVEPWSLCVSWGYRPWIMADQMVRLPS